MIDIPVTPGSYILELELNHLAVLQIGKLGRFAFPPARYLYLGSACGPGGLQARLFRHIGLSKSSKQHWHIDYFRSVARPIAVYWVIGCLQKPDEPPTECQWSQSIADITGVFVPAPAFGASDCLAGCPAHLFGFPYSNSQTLLSDAALHQRLTDQIDASVEMTHYQPLDWLY